MHNGDSCQPITILVVRPTALSKHRTLILILQSILQRSNIECRCINTLFLATDTSESLVELQMVSSPLSTIYLLIYNSNSTTESPNNDAIFSPFQSFSAVLVITSIQVTELDYSIEFTSFMLSIFVFE